MRKKYNTPHRSRVVKTRLSEDEYADFTARLAPYGISQSEFLRQAIRRTAIRPVIHVSAVNDELLSAVGKLTAEYGRIGGNLNQIARYLNEYGAPYNALSGEVRAAIADLAALKYEVLQKVGDAVGNTQAYVKWSMPRSCCRPMRRPNMQTGRPSGTPWKLWRTSGTPSLPGASCWRSR